MAVPGKPFVLPYANDASWRLVGLVLFATEFLVATLLASGLWLALSIGRPMCALYLSVCNILGLIADYFNSIHVAIFNAIRNFTILHK